MLCKNCKTLIPDNSLSCPNCKKFPAILDEHNVFQNNDRVPAKWWKRLLNYFLDMIFFYVCIFVLSFIFGIFSLDIFPGNGFVDTFVSLGYYMLYYLITEFLFGRSLGKFITRTHIISFDNRKPGFKNIFIRTISRFIPFDAFSLLSYRPIGWHDSLAKTLVVEKKSLIPGENKEGTWN